MAGGRLTAMAGQIHVEPGESPGGEMPFAPLPQNRATVSTTRNVQSMEESLASSGHVAAVSLGHPGERWPRASSQYTT